MSEEGFNLKPLNPRARIVNIEYKLQANGIFRDSYYVGLRNEETGRVTRVEVTSQEFARLQQGEKYSL